MLHASQRLQGNTITTHIFYEYIENNGNNLIEILPVHDGRDRANRFG